MQTAITLEDWEQRKAFLGFSDNDVEALSWIQPMSGFFVNEVVETLYRYLHNFERTAAFLQDEVRLERLRSSQSQYFLELFAGDYGEAYLNSRIRIGLVHHQVGLPLSLYMATYSHYFMLIRPHIFEYIDDENEAFQVLDSLAKLITLDETVAVDAYVEAIHASKT